MKHNLLIIFILILKLPLYAEAGADTSKKSPASILSDSSVRLWRDNKYDDALIIANQAYKLAKSGTDSLQLAKCLNNIGMIYGSKGDPGKSLFYYEQSLSILRLLKNSDLLPSSLLNIGIIYKEQAIYDKALSNLFEAAIQFEKFKDSLKLSNAYNAIGNTFGRKNENHKALKYHFKALALRKQIRFDEGIASSFNNIGVVYKALGLYDSALFYLNTSLKIKQANSRPEKLANTLSQIGDVNALQGNYKVAQNYYFDSYKLRRELGNKVGIARSKFELGKLYFEWKNLALSKEYLLQCLTLAGESKTSDLLLKSYDLLKQIYKKEKNYSRALYFADEYIKINDTILGEKHQKNITQVEVRYETEKKQNEILALNQEKEKREAVLLAQQFELKMKENRSRNMVIGIVFLLMIIILLSLLFRDRFRFAKKLDMVMRELHHRVMNNFQILLSLFRLQLDNIRDENIQKIILSNSNRITSMMLIHRDLYLDKDITQVNISTYIKTLVENLETIYKTKEKNIDLVYYIHPHLKIKVDKSISVGLLVNELVTNSFKYAFGETNMNPRLEISLGEDETKTYKLIIKDNGPGLQAIDTKNSLGLKLVDSQVKALKGRMEIKETDGLSFEISFK